MRLDAKNTMFFPPFLVQKLFSKALILLKSNIFLFDVLWEAQNVTEGGKTGYGWIQNIPNFTGVFVAKLHCR